MCVGVLSAHVSVCMYTCVLGAGGSQKRASTALELEFQRSSFEVPCGFAGYAMLFVVCLF